MVSEMSSREFIYLNKSQSQCMLPLLFEILHDNMTPIAPTGNAYEEDLNTWTTLTVPSLKDTQRQIVLMYVDKELAGFFQYWLNKKTNSLVMEQLQIKNKFQRSGLFTAFFQWLVRRLPQDIYTVEAFIDKKNLLSQAIWEHIGLVRSGENENGNSFYYNGSYNLILMKYQ